MQGGRDDGEPAVVDREERQDRPAAGRTQWDPHQRDRRGREEHRDRDDAPSPVGEDDDEAREIDRKRHNPEQGR